MLRSILAEWLSMEEDYREKQLAAHLAEVAADEVLEAQDEVEKRIIDILLPESTADDTKYFAIDGKVFSATRWSDGTATLDLLEVTTVN